MVLLFSLLMTGAKLDSTLSTPNQSVVFKKKSTEISTINTRAVPVKQGFFCDFEDMLKRKKIPINLGVGEEQ